MTVIVCLPVSSGGSRIVLRAYEMVVLHKDMEVLMKPSTGGTLLPGKFVKIFAENLHLVNFREL